MTDHRWGIDLGGTKIELAILPAAGGEPIFRRRVPTESDRGYDQILANVAGLVEAASYELQIKPERVGIGTPGTTDPHSGLLKNSNTQCLNGRPFRDDLAARLGVEVRAANDANCFALAEATMGVAKGYPTVFGIIMGTGVGGGLVVNGQVLEGAHGIAGEWGHNLLDPQGNWGYSGHRGIVETVLSGPALERYYAECTGTPRKLKEIVERVGQNELAAIRTMERLYAMFGRAVAQIVNVFDPHAIVLGGGVGNVPGLSERGAEEAARWVFNPAFQTPILKPSLGDSAGVFGAAML
ncbi:ROK family protein [bacterium]|nr:MAG: ROK family protein [bacterium]